MSKNKYNWRSGATLEDHSRRKLKVIREYFSDYLSIRCQLPQRGSFRLAIVDGFSGGGRYSCGTAGSPILFIEELRASTIALNLGRVAKGLKEIQIECLLIFCDDDPCAIDSLRENAEPLLAEIKECVPKLYIHNEYLNSDFTDAYLDIIRIIQQGSFQNLIFNLDQYGHSAVPLYRLVDIMAISRSVEIFYTFAIQALISFLDKGNPSSLQKKLNFLGLTRPELQALEQQLTRHEWLGAAERLVFETFKSSAAYVSPFSINNPDGWRYWLLHFANSFRARQAYNNILHKNSGEQAHFGRSGLSMHSYDPSKNGQLYLFDGSARQLALEQLYDDIPRVVSSTGDAMPVGEFYEGIYNTTPAHSDDINSSMIQNEDIQIVTANGGERRTAANINPLDIIRLRKQRSFFPIFRRGQKHDE